MRLHTLCLPIAIIASPVGREPFALAYAVGAGYRPLPGWVTAASVLCIGSGRGRHQRRVSQVHRNANTRIPKTAMSPFPTIGRFGISASVDEPWRNSFLRSWRLNGKQRSTFPPCSSHPDRTRAPGGCDTGTLDHIKGPGSRKALSAFSERSGIEFPATIARYR